MSYVVTGATGQLGRLVIEALLRDVPAVDIVALARDPGKATDLAELGVQVKQADYSRPETFVGKFGPNDRVLLISSSELGNRVAQHQAVIDAASAAGVAQILYTSVLRADTSTLGVAKDHRETEEAISETDLSWVILRNGWYLENYAGRVQSARETHKLFGSSGEGRIAAAARVDYADAAAAALTGSFASGTILELAGDDSFTLGELAGAISHASGTEVAYVNLSEEQYQRSLVEQGLPDSIASLIADGDARAAEGALFDDSKTLSKLIRRGTTSFKEAVTDSFDS